MLIIHGDRGWLSYVGQVSQPAVFQAGWETCPTLMNNPGCSGGFYLGNLG